MNINLRIVLLCLALFASPFNGLLANESPFGQESSSSILSSPLASSSLLSAPEFVPVEQAYQFNLVVEDQQLVFNWDIRDGYYLYRDRFDFRSLDSSLELQPASFETGVVKWDEFFEKDLEVYYSQTSVRIPFSSTSDRLLSYRSNLRAARMPGSVIRPISSGWTLTCKPVRWISALCHRRLSRQAVKPQQRIFLWLQFYSSR